MPKVVDIAGQRFGLLVVQYISGERGRHKVRIWRCICDCGNERDVPGIQLRSGATTHCGEQQHPRGHGQSRTRTYRAWANMLHRCQNTNAGNYADYGGRGIQVCERWQKFANFYRDMGDCPPKQSLDRINNDGNYEPGNCRWATIAQQQNNRRCTTLFEYQGQKHTIAEWAAILSIPDTSLRRAINKGKAIEQYLTERKALGL